MELCVARGLDDCLSKEDIPSAMLKYQQRRNTRTEIIQEGAQANGRIWHLRDGEEQRR
jgi:hypothetical protein